MKQTLYNIAATLLFFLAGQSAWAASTFTVTNTSGTSKFVITRTTNTSTTETVKYRTVSLSAVAGKHFTEKVGDLTFDATHNSREVEVTETPSGSVDEQYHFQTGTTRSYRFEVLDLGGFKLASCDRAITSGLSQFSAAKVSSNVTNLVTMSNGNFSSGMSSSKYLDVSYTPPTGDVQTSKQDLPGYVLIDDSYDYEQKPSTVSTSTLISSTGASASYLNTLGYKIYATVCFTEKERDDGYQYLQIVAGNSSASYDTGADPNGQVNNPSNSVYKVCFELADGTNSEGKAYFPHRGTTNSEFSISTGVLHQQKYKSGYDGNGSVVLNPTVSDITTRFDAGGEHDDTWGYKDFFVRMALCDNNAPTLLGDPVVSGSMHAKGNTFYVSIPFNEIVTVTDTPTLSTTWGSASYVTINGGSGSNVLTFSGNITADAGTALTVNSISGTIKDLAGNELTSAGKTINKSYGTTVDASAAFIITYDLAGGTVAIDNSTEYTWETATFTLNNPTRPGYHFDGWTGSNGNTPQTTVTITNHSHENKSFTANWTPLWGQDGGADGSQAHPYIISSVAGMEMLAKVTNGTDGFTANPSDGIFYQLGNNIDFEGGSFDGIGLNNNYFDGNFDGDGKTISNLVINKPSISRVGIIGDCIHGTIKNIIVDNATVSGSNHTAVIMGTSYDGTIVNCQVYNSTVNCSGTSSGVVYAYISSFNNVSNCHYANCTINGTPASDMYLLTLGAGITASGEAVVHGTDTYYVSGTTVTLSSTESAPEGYEIFFRVNGTPIAGNTFSMPAEGANVTKSVTAIPWSGSGESANDPYLIQYRSQLDLLASNVNGGNNYSGKYFKLVNDICYSHTTAWNDANSEENNYTAIGIYSQRPFKGIFDGNGHTVSGIRIYKPNGDYQGLFGKVSAGTVKNVTLSDTRITGLHDVGGIAGEITKNNSVFATVSNCHVDNTVAIHTVKDNIQWHGGIVGYCNYSNITGCTSSVVLTKPGNSVSCNDFGGITGSCNHGSLTDNFVMGAIICGDDKSGAILGINDYVEAASRNYYYSCSVNGNTDNVGCGEDPVGDITANDGAVQVFTITLGAGISVSPTAVVTYQGTAYYTAGTTITLSHGSAPAGYQEPFLGYSLNGTSIDGNSFEMPADDAVVTALWTVMDYTSGHAGTEADPYIIYNKDQLNQLASRANASVSYTQGKYFKLGADIEYDGTENNYTPIGTSGEHFRGTFDGDGHTISGININSTASRLALFGDVRNGIVKNVTLERSSFTGDDHIAGIVGYIYKTVIYNCRVENTVTIKAVDGYASHHGGIVGGMSSTGSTIEGCISMATVIDAGFSNMDYFGGIAGSNQGVLKNCLVLGATITANTPQRGAIAGWNPGGVLSNNYYNNCYSTNRGCNNADITENDGAVRAVSSTTKPAEIGVQIATYPHGGLTVYEHGAFYKGTYYLRHDLAGTAVGLNLTQGAKDGVTAWWGTFYDGTTNHTLGEGTTAYTLGTDYKLYRLGADGATIPKGVAVIIIATSADTSLIPVGTDDLSITDHAVGGNQLHGSDSAVSVSGLSGTPYVLGVVNDVLGFYPYTGSEIPASKAYYVVE